MDRIDYLQMAVDYPKGMTWIDKSSIDENNMVDVYIMDDEWRFLERRKLTKNEKNS